MAFLHSDRPLFAQGVTAPYVQPFDGIAGQPAALVAGNGLSTLGPAWDVVYGDPASRARVGHPGTQMSLGAYFPAPVTGQTGACLVLDRFPSGAVSTQAVVLHVNYAASTHGQGIVLRFFLRENNDETHPNDVIALQDGVTTGTGIQNTGLSTGLPGYDGFKEALLSDWNASGAGSSWTEFSFTIDDVYLTTTFGPAATATTDLRIIFRQQDNFPLDGGDGLLIDQVRVHASQTTTGQAPQPGFATLDIDSACDRSGYPVGSNRAGPYRTTVANGWGTFEVSVTGAANQPIVLLFGASSVATATFPGIGQVDIGVANPLPPFVPTGISIDADGTQPGVFNSFFTTGAAGQNTIVFGMPIFPVTGVIGSFQAAVLTGGASVIAMSNAVELEIL